MSPNTGIIIGKQFKFYAYFICFFLVYLVHL